ncbi:MAG: shikimate kinase [Deltaproteobacteria bacterium]|nr:shikimate kinase [Deltaproteobacteria bacterium]
MKSIILIGMPGSGKTTVGMELAKYLDLELHDTDSIIESHYGFTIENWIKNRQSEFREIEYQLLKKLSTGGNIISCGGGIIENPNSMEILKHNFTIWLKTSTEILTSRILSTPRPVYNMDDDIEDQIKNLLSRRILRYSDSSLLSVDTGILTTEEVVHVVQHVWRSFFSNNLR